MPEYVHLLETSFIFSFIFIAISMDAIILNSVDMTLLPRPFFLYFGLWVKQPDAISVARFLADLFLFFQIQWGANSHDVRVDSVAFMTATINLL